MKKWLFVLLAIITVFLPSVSFSASREYYIREADAVITLPDEWVCVTRDTKPEDVDLAGTVFNYDGVKSALLQTIEMLKDPQYSGIHLVAMGADEKAGLVEVQLGTKTDTATQSVWDISLLPKDTIESIKDEANAFELYSDKADTWLGLEQEEGEYYPLSYITFNNGRNVTVSVTAYGANTRQQQATIAHKVLDRIQFTKKDAKPVLDVIESDETDDERSTLSSWFKKMWRLMERYIAFELSGWVVMGGIAITFLALSFIVSLFKRR